MSLYSKGLLLKFFRPNFFFEGLGCGLPQPRPALKKKLLLMPYVSQNKIFIDSTRFFEKKKYLIALRACFLCLKEDFTLRFNVLRNLNLATLRSRLIMSLRSLFGSGRLTGVLRFASLHSLSQIAFFSSENMGCRFRGKMRLRKTPYVQRNRIFTF